MVFHARQMTPIFNISKNEIITFLTLVGILVTLQGSIAVFFIIISQLVFIGILIVRLLMAAYRLLSDRLTRRNSPFEPFPV